MRVEDSDWGPEISLGLGNSAVAAMQKLLYSGPVVFDGMGGKEGRKELGWYCMEYAGRVDSLLLFLFLPTNASGHRHRDVAAHMRHPNLDPCGHYIRLIRFGGIAAFDPGRSRGDGNG